MIGDGGGENGEGREGKQLIARLLEGEHPLSK